MSAISSAFKRGRFRILAGLSETSTSLKFGGLGSGAESNAWAWRGAGFAAIAVEGRVRVRVRAAEVGRRVGEPEEERLRKRRPAGDEVDRLSGQHVLLEVGGCIAVADQGAVLVQRVVVDRLGAPGPPRATPTSPAGPAGCSSSRSGTCRSWRCSSRLGEARRRGCCFRAGPGSGRSRRSAALLLSTPWLCAYWPVRKVARDGQQSDMLTKLFSNVAPWLPISELTLPITRIDSTVWSSVSITTMFGRAWAATAGSRVTGGVPEPATARPPVVANVAKNNNRLRPRSRATRLGMYRRCPRKPTTLARGL